MGSANVNKQTKNQKFSKNFCIVVFVPFCFFQRYTKKWEQWR